MYIDKPIRLLHISESQGGIRILHEARRAGTGKDSKGGGLTPGIRTYGCGFLKCKM